MKRFLQLATLAAFLAPTAALAHVGVGNTSGFMPGFMHPLSGLDHQLAMILVGVAGRPVPFVEIGIAPSVIVLGAVVAFGVKAPLAVAMGAVGLFAIFHGHAHGSEIPLDASGFEYGIGFILATSVLHATGIFIAMLIGLSTRVLGNNLYRLAGGLASVAGLALLLGYA